MFRSIVILSLLIPIFGFIQGCADGASESSNEIDSKTLFTSAIPEQTFHNKSIEVSLDCDGNCNKIYYSINNETIPQDADHLYSGSFPITSAAYANQIVQVRYFAVNLSGAKEATHIKEYVIDTIKPQITGISNAGVGEFTSAQSVQVFCTDSTSPNASASTASQCKNVIYQFIPTAASTSPNFTSIPKDQAILIQESGTLHYRVEDGAGNESDENTADFTFINNLENISNLTATTSTNLVILNWTKPTAAEILGVAIRRSSVAAVVTPSDGTQIYKGADTTFSDTNVIDGTTYFYRVFSYDANDNYSTGRGIEATPPGDITAPAEITDLIKTPSDKSIAMSWKNPNDADFDHVVIQRAADASPTSISEGISIYTGAETTFVDTDNLINDTQYFYTIFTVDITGNVSAGKTFFEVPKDNIAPAPVTQLTIQALDSKLTLSWTNPMDADYAGTRVVRNVAATPANETDGDIVFEGNTKVYTDINLTNGTTYFYALFAYDGKNNFSTSTSINGTPILDTTIPTVVGTSPTSDELDVPSDLSSVTVDFSEDVLASSVTGAISIKETVSGKIVNGNSQQSATNSTQAIFNINQPQLALTAQHTVTVAAQVSDLNNKAMAADYSWNFTTADGAWGNTAQPIENNATDGVIYTAEKHIGIDDMGNAHAVWEHYESLSGTAIYANRYDAVTGWDETKMVRISQPSLTAESVSLAVMPNGNAIAVWAQEGLNGNNIWGARYLAGNPSWDTPVEIQDNRVGAFTPKISANSKGNVVIAWLEDNTGSRDVWAKQFNFDNWPNLPAGQAIETSTDSASSLRLAIDANGSAMAIWLSKDGTGNSNLMYNRYSSSAVSTAGSWQATESGPINSNLTLPVTWPQISMADDGSAIAIWQEGNNRIWANHFDALTATWETTATAVNADTVTLIFANSNIGLASHAKGTFLAAWRELDSATNSSTTSVVARYKSGIGWSTVEPISANTGIEYRVVLDANENGFIYWSGGSNTYALRYTANMALRDLFVKPVKSLDDISGNILGLGYGSIGINNKGIAMAIWPISDPNIILYDLRANRFSAVPSQPNLSVTISNTSTVLDATGNVEITIDYTVSNDGKAASGSFDVNLWGSLAASPSIGQIGDTTVSHSSLNGGDTFSGSVTILTGATTQTGTAYAIVDSTNAIVESNELDNISAGAAWLYNPTVMYFDFESNRIPFEISMSTTPTRQWFVDKTTDKNFYALRSFAGVAQSQLSCFKLPVNDTHGHMSFWFKTDSTINGGILQLYIDKATPNFGNYDARWSGKLDWQSWSTDNLATVITPGPHVYEWCYYKANTNTAGTLDAVWVDDILIEK